MNPWKKGGDSTDDVIQNLKDTGCDETNVERIHELYRSGQVREAIKVLRRHRCDLMEKLHESQDRIDTLDFLVRWMEGKL